MRRCVVLRTNKAAVLSLKFLIGLLLGVILLLATVKVYSGVLGIFVDRTDDETLQSFERLELAIDELQDTKTIPISIREGYYITSNSYKPDTCSTLCLCKGDVKEDDNCRIKKETVQVTKYKYTFEGDPIIVGKEGVQTYQLQKISDTRIHITLLSGNQNPSYALDVEDAMP